MNDLQRSEAVRLFSERATIAEVIGMVETTRPDFSREWTVGKAGAESGDSSELVEWYLAASSARSRARAELRAEAVDCAGEKRSGDLLAVLRALESEEEPTFTEEGSIRSRSPFLDVLDHPERYSDETKRLISEAELATRAAFCAWNAERMTVVA